MAMQGLYKSTGYWQTQEARRDWAFLQRWAEDNGYGELATGLAPKNGDGWRKIDKCIDRLRGAVTDCPPCPSNTAEHTEWARKQHGSLTGGGE